MLFYSLQAGSELDGVTFGRKDNRFLLRFLRARKYNMDRALQLYVNYFKYRKKFGHLLEDFHPHHVQDVIQLGLFGVLPKPLHNGSRAICVIPSRWDYENVHPNQPYKTFLLMLEKLAEDEEVQVHGLSIFDNMAGTSWHLAYAFVCSEQLQKGALVELQDSFPIRFKGFHMLNQPWYLSMVMAIIRPFLSQKHRDRIQAHGDNYEALHEFVDPDILPGDFGGNAPDLDSDNLRLFFAEEVSDGSVSSRTISIHSGRE